MQLNNNLSSMLQLEKKLEQSTNELTKLSLNDNQLNTQNKKQGESQKETNVVNEMVKQVEIPLAYTANGQIISTQDSVTKTLLDIKA